MPRNTDFPAVFLAGRLWWRTQLKTSETDRVVFVQASLKLSKNWCAGTRFMHRSISPQQKDHHNHGRATTHCFDSLCEQNVGFRRGGAQNERSTPKNQGVFCWLPTRIGLPFLFWLPVLTEYGPKIRHTHLVPPYPGQVWRSILPRSRWKVKATRSKY